MEFCFLSHLVVVEEAVADDSVPALAQQHDLVAPVQNQLSDDGLAGSFRPAPPETV